MPLPALGGSFLTIQVQVASAQVSGKGRGFRVAKANFSKQGKANVILMHTYTGEETAKHLHHLS
jgi:anti-sigma factor ChrR (cupin superfamily)